jgi:hypothetical protein
MEEAVSLASGLITFSKAEVTTPQRFDLCDNMQLISGFVENFTESAYAAVITGSLWDGGTINPIQILPGQTLRFAYQKFRTLYLTTTDAFVQLAAYKTPVLNPRQLSDMMAAGYVDLTTSGNRAAQYVTKSSVGSGSITLFNGPCIVYYLAAVLYVSTGATDAGQPYDGTNSLSGGQDYSISAGQTQVVAINSAQGVRVLTALKWAGGGTGGLGIIAFFSPIQ